jgi:hypothetical protein
MRGLTLATGKIVKRQTNRSHHTKKKPAEFFGGFHWKI